LGVSQKVKVGDHNRHPSSERGKPGGKGKLQENFLHLDKEQKPTNKKKKKKKPKKKKKKNPKNNHPQTPKTPPKKKKQNNHHQPTQKKGKVKLMGRSPLSPRESLEERVALKA